MTQINFHFSDHGVDFLTEDLWVGAADPEAEVGRGNPPIPPIRKNSSSLVDLGPTVEAFLTWFDVGSTKVLVDEIIWLYREPLPRSTTISYVKALRHYFQWVMEDQGADEECSLLDRFEWNTMKHYMDRFFAQILLSLTCWGLGAEGLETEGQEV